MRARWRTTTVTASRVRCLDSPRRGTHSITWTPQQRAHPPRNWKLQSDGRFLPQGEEILQCRYPESLEYLDLVGFQKNHRHRKQIFTLAPGESQYHVLGCIDKQSVPLGLADPASLGHLSRSVANQPLGRVLDRKSSSDPFDWFVREIGA